MKKSRFFILHDLVYACSTNITKVMTWINNFTFASCCILNVIFEVGSHFTAMGNFLQLFKS